MRTNNPYEYMKTLLCGLVAALLTMLSASAVITFTSVTETEFDGVNVSSRVFNAELIEQGNFQGNSALYETAIGDGNWQTPAAVGQYAWDVNNYHLFEIAVDESGNGTITIDGALQLTDQPLGAINEVWIGNRNGAGVPFQQLWLRDMTFNGIELPDIDTAGPESFGGLRISGIDDEPWSLQGKIMWYSDDGTADGTLAHFSRLSVYGSEVTVPEPSSSLLLMMSITLMLSKRSRRSAAGLFNFVYKYTGSYPQR